MAAARKPGSQCSHNNPVDTDDGTMCLAESPIPLSIGISPPDNPVRRFDLGARSLVVPAVAASSKRQDQTASRDRQLTVRQIATGIAKSANEAEQLLKQINEDEKALTSEIDKVRLDIEAWEDVRKWFDSESRKREVLVAEAKDRFNFLRWGGKGTKVGGIDTNAGGDVVLNRTFEASHRAVVVEGYNRHEQFHKKTYKGMGTFEAAWGYVAHGHQSWVTDRLITDELQAHQTQEDFYEDSLSKIPAQKADVEKRLKELRAK